MPFDIYKWIEEKELERIRAGVTKLKPEERLAGLSLEERLAGLSLEERLAGMSLEERLAGMSLEERLAGMSLEELEAIEKALDARRNNAKPG